MEAKDVRIYYKLPKNQEHEHKRFYNFYNEPCERLEMSNFLNSIVDYEENNNNEINNIIYGIINQEIVKEYYVIMTFKNITNNKNYIVYTDNQNDQDLKKKIYSAIYDMDAPDPFIGFLTTNEEWMNVCALLDAIFLYKH